jgi:hypothetical protein
MSTSPDSAGELAILWRAQDRQQRQRERLSRIAAGALRAERRARGLAIAEAAVIIGLVTLLVLAMRHAADAADVARAALPVAVMLALGLARVQHRSAVMQCAAPPSEFVIGEHHRLRAECRSLRAILLLDVAALLFHVPWAIDGYRIHRELWDELAVVSGWLPLCAMLAIGWWAAVSYQRLRNQTRTLAQLTHD